MSMSITVLGEKLL